MVTFAEAKAQRIQQLQAAIAAEITANPNKNITFLWQQLAGVVGNSEGSAAAAPSERSQYVDTVSAANQQIAIAPGVGKKYKITFFYVQNRGTSASTMLLKSAASSPALAFPIRCPVDGSGSSQLLGEDDGLEFPENTPIIADPSTTGAHTVFLKYIVIDS